MAKQFDGTISRLSVSADRVMTVEHFVDKWLSYLRQRRRREMTDDLTAMLAERDRAMRHELDVHLVTNNIFHDKQLKDREQAVREEAASIVEHYRELGLTAYSDNLDDRTRYPDLDAIAKAIRAESP